MAIKRYQPERLETVKCAIVGQAGRGKTTLAKTLKEKTILIAAEPGLLSVRDEIKSGKIEALEVHSLADLVEVYQYVKDDKSIKASNLYIDSISEISDIVFKDLDGKMADKRAVFGEFGKQMVNLIKSFRDLPQYSVFFTALESTETDEFNRRYIGPQVAGKMLKEKFTSLFDLVLFYDMQLDAETQEYKRTLVTGNYKSYPGKDRSGKLDLFMPPDLSLIKSKILAGE